jgi:archaellum biogenesis ATPase FlaH
MPGASVQIVDLPEVKFYLEPYIPHDSIIFLHGKWGTYKTPVTLALAKAIAQGQPEIFGCKVEKAKVLYIQADTPKRVIIPRMQVLDVNVDNLDFIFCYPGFDILEWEKDDNDRFIHDILSKVHRDNKYDVVMIDSLRAIHTKDDKEATTVHSVYRALRRMFPGASILIIHHDKKSSPEGLPGDESFSGSQAWVNHATVGLKISHLDKTQGHVQLEHTKSQASELVEPLKIEIKQGILAKCLTSANIDELEGYFSEHNNLEQANSLAELDKQVGAYFGVGERTARRRRMEAMEQRPFVKALLEGRYKSNGKK